MYLKEGDIGKAESEEVVPVKTETEIVSQAGSAGRTRGSSLLTQASWDATPPTGRALPPLAHLPFTQPW